MPRYASSVILFLILCSWSVLPASAAGLSVGQLAPAFNVQSGDEKNLDSNQLRGKVVTLFYEARDAQEKSKALKDAMKDLYAEQPPAIQKLVARVAVVDCSTANFLSKGFWQDGLEEASQKEGFTIYGDWEGKMREDFQLPEGGSSFLVLDPGGAIKYLALDTAQIGPEQITRIKEIISQTTKQAEAK